jgi:hypothetical protein
MEATRFSRMPFNFYQEDNEDRRIKLIVKSKVIPVTGRGGL